MGSSAQQWAQQQVEQALARVAALRAAREAQGRTPEQIEREISYRAIVGGGIPAARALLRTAYPPYGQLPDDGGEYDDGDEADPRR